MTFSLIISFILLSELNRFTINSINHNHTNASRLALRDDGGGTPTAGRAYWLRSAGSHTINSAVSVDTTGGRFGFNASGGTTIGIRPIL